MPNGGPMFAECTVGKPGSGRSQRDGSMIRDVTRRLQKLERRSAGAKPAATLSHTL
jgi:hypothetical protein